MQGVSLITDASGQPAVLTIDLRNVPADASPLLESLLARVQQDVDDTERSEWLNFSATQLNRAYGDDEPDYTAADLKWENPHFAPDAIR